jgi:hypothetical protein
MFEIHKTCATAQPKNLEEQVRQCIQVPAAEIIDHREMRMLVAGQNPKRNHVVRRSCNPA